MGLASTSGIMFSLMSIPFVVDALVGVVSVYNQNKKQAGDYVLAEVNSEIDQDRKLFPEAVQGVIDRFVETEFYKEFCLQNWKKNAFELK